MRKNLKQLKMWLNAIYNARISADFFLAKLNGVYYGFETKFDKSTEIELGAGEFEADRLDVPNIIRWGLGAVDYAWVLSEEEGRELEEKLEKSRIVAMFVDEEEVEQWNRLTQN